MFEEFIDDLARTKVPENVYNQYSYKDQANSIRRENLLIYLKEMYKLAPKLILIAEAPGYRGSRITGVPFTSEDLLLNNMDGLDLFGPQKGYRLPLEETKLRKEATATIIWETLIKEKTIALGWNAFPFHPYRRDNVKSNRTPLKKELLIGEEFILKIIDLFAIEQIVSVGNKAYNSLSKLGIGSSKVRHPAQGGKNDFVNGIEKIIAENLLVESNNKVRR